MTEQNHNYIKKGDRQALDRNLANQGADPQYSNQRYFKVKIIGSMISAHC